MLNGRLYKKEAVQQGEVVAFMGENGLQVFRPNPAGDCWVNGARYAFTGEPGDYFPELEGAAETAMTNLPTFDTPVIFKADLQTVIISRANSTIEEYVAKEMPSGHRATGMSKQQALQFMEDLKEEGFAQQ